MNKDGKSLGSVKKCEKWTFSVKSECECFIRVSKHEKADESTRSQVKCYYSVSEFRKPDGE